MINQQLVEYIKQQTQAGVSKDAVRKALSDAGWPPADVDDSVKAAELAAPVGGLTSASPVSRGTIDPVVAMGGAEAAAAGPSLETARSGFSGASGNKFFAKPVSPAGAMAEDDDDDHPSVKKLVMAMIAMGIVILVLAGALAFVYFNMSGRTASGQNAAPGAPDQVAPLQAQVAQLNRSNADLAAQVASLNAMNADLASEAAFFAAPPANATSSAATVKGTLTGNGTLPFVLTTAHNLKIYVANYKDAKVQAVLLPLANGTTTVQLSGTHAAASPNLTVTAVNGAAL